MIALLLLLQLATGHTDWTSLRSRPEAVLEGAFSSCPDGEDGAYGEQVFVWRPHAIALAEIHLGPRAEFAVFADEVAGERDHHGAANLLGSAFAYDDVASRTGRNWSIPSLHLHVNIRRAPGSFEECYSFFVLIVPLPYTAVAR